MGTNRGWRDYSIGGTSYIDEYPSEAFEAYVWIMTLTYGTSAGKDSLS